ncbi:MAG TPA: HEAT repeat domain-containing protein, partial [Saprospiraceae bacterium]|nr:HEAT repeat domain-containing protein [Saprospiraceae bacterium]
VMPAGDNTGAGSPTGIVINEGDALGDKYRGILLSAEAGRNVIYAYKPKRSGAGYRFERFNLIGSVEADNINYKWHEDTLEKSMWFRPSDLCIGTDGAIYIADWYDPIVGGHQMRERNGYGRIYRIQPKNKSLQSPALRFDTPAGLIEAVRNPAINVRYQAFEKIRALGPSMIPRVQTLLKDPNPYIRMRAIWLLATLGEKGKAEAIRLLDHRDPEKNMVAFRALRQADSSHVPEYAQQLIRKKNPLLNREIAFAVRGMKFADARSLLKDLIGQYQDPDAYMLAAIAAACKRKEDSVYSQILKPLLDSTNWKPAMVAVLHAIRPPGACEDIVHRLSLPGKDSTKIKLLGTLAFIPSPCAVKGMAGLIRSEDSSLVSEARWWLAFRRTNDWQDLVDWGAYDSLIVDPETRIWNEGLNRLMTEKGGARLEAALELALDPSGGLLILQLISNGKLDPALSRQISDTLFYNPNPVVRAMAGDLFWKNKYQYSIDVIKRMEMNEDSGRLVFNRACIHCHQFGGKGGSVGPDLSAVAGKMDVSSLLDAIINPGAGIVFGYEATAIKTTDGMEYTGFVMSDGDPVRLKDILGKVHDIPQKTIVGRYPLRGSLMPPPQNLMLRDVDLAHLVGYLKNNR